MDVRKILKAKQELETALQLVDFTHSSLRSMVRPSTDLDLEELRRQRDRLQDASARLEDAMVAAYGFDVSLLRADGQAVQSPVLPER